MVKSNKEKVTVSVDPTLLGWLDSLVQDETYDSRSAALEAALQSFYKQRAEQQLERALAALTDEDIKEGIAMAEEGLDDYAEQLRDSPW